MKKLLTLAVSAVALMAIANTAYAAESATETYAIEATVPNTCNIPNTPSEVLGGGATYATGTFDGGMSFDGAIDVTDATLNVASVALTYTDAMCNYAATVGVQTTNGGMTQTSGTLATSTVGGTFLDRIDYTASAAFCGVVPSITTNNTPGAKTNAACGGANIGSLVVTVSTANGAVPILQGLYQDTLTVQIGAAL